MADRGRETCPSCGKWTEAGKAKYREYFKAHPISKIDLSRPLHELVEEFRAALADVRGKMNDIGVAFPGWGERLVSVEGLLTCGLVALHNIKEEMRGVAEAAKSGPQS